MSIATSEERAAGTPPAVRPTSSRRAAWKRIPKSSWIDVGIAVVVVVVMAAPVLFTNRAFQFDTTNSMWMGKVMSHSLTHGLPPTYFLNTNSGYLPGLFNPAFAFYGGPLFAFFGIVIWLVGGSLVAGFEVLMLLAFFTAYGGTFWFSRQCGLRGRLAHVPAIVVVSAAYYLTNLYGRGDVAEFVAVSVIPLVVASATHLVNTRKWTPGPTLLLVVSVIFFTGSHNITLLWATLVGAVALVVLAVVLRPRVSVSRLSAVAGVIVLATMVNAWYLLPDVAFSGTTSVAAHPGVLYPFFDRLSVLLNPGRLVPRQSSAPALFVQAPVWFMAWSVVCGVWIWCTRSLQGLRKAWTAMAFLLAALIALIADTPLWSRLPDILQEIQFAYRLNGYVLLLAAGLVLVSLLALQRELTTAPRSKFVTALVASLVGVTAISAGLAVWQGWTPHTCDHPLCIANRNKGLTSTLVLPPTWYAGNIYTNSKEPVVPVEPGRVFTFSAQDVDRHGDRMAVTTPLPPGTEPFETNIMGGPQLVSIGGGIERVGRTVEGLVVVRRVVPGDGPVAIDIHTAHSPAIELGRWMSLAGVLGVALLLVAQVRPRRRRAHEMVEETSPASL